MATRRNCIIFDIDGTVADLKHRRHYVTGGAKNWKAFFDEVSGDSLIEQTVYLNGLLSHVKVMPIFFVSGRTDACREDTVKWLAHFGMQYDNLYMRKEGDYRRDDIVKKEILEQIRSEGFEPWLIFDDRQQVVDMWRKEGLFVLQCDPAEGGQDFYQFDKSIEWPLTILVGPSGAGKSTWAYDHAYLGSVISSDVVREQITGDLDDMTQQKRVFDSMLKIATARLECGLPVTLDATYLDGPTRREAAKLVGEDIKVRYIVLDRPMADKIATGGRRNTITVKGKPLMEHHAEGFKNNLPNILKGDNLPNVTVFDKRTK